MKKVRKFNQFTFADGFTVYCVSLAKDIKKKYEAEHGKIKYKKFLGAI